MNDMHLTEAALMYRKILSQNLPSSTEKNQAILSLNSWYLGKYVSRPSSFCDSPQCIKLFTQREHNVDAV
jgi:hypothetical protein